MNSKQEFTSRTLVSILNDAFKCSKVAKRNQLSLFGDNFYASKFFRFKTEAANLLKNIRFAAPENTSAITELIDTFFNPRSDVKTRLNVIREISYRFDSEHGDLSSSVILEQKKQHVTEQASLLPLQILAESKRGYIQRIGNEINGCYSNGHYSACLVMIRRLLEISIIEVFEFKKIEYKITDANGNYLMLEALVDSIGIEGSVKLSRATKQYLPQLRELGNLSAHGKHFHAKPEDVNRVAVAVRSSIEELLRSANLIS